MGHTKLEDYLRCIRILRMQIDLIKDHFGHQHYHSQLIEFLQILNEKVISIISKNGITDGENE